MALWKFPKKPSLQFSRQVTKPFHSFLHPSNLNIELWRECNGFEIYIQREDDSFLSLGSKMRRIQGFLNLDTKLPILIQGSLGSNFLTSFALALSLHGFSVFVLAKTYELSPHSLNFYLLKKYSKELYFGSNKVLEFTKDQICKKYPDIQVIPKYGFSREGEFGYESLWKQITCYPIVNQNENLIVKKKSETLNSESESSFFDTIVLDIGSGLSYLSAANYFQTLNTKILGVCIGESKTSWLRNLPERMIQLGWDEKQRSIIKIPKDHLVNPVILPKFAETNDLLLDFIKDIYRDSHYKLRLEPIYSAKTLFTLLYYLNDQSLYKYKIHKIIRNVDLQFKEKIFQSPQRKILYIHQGGLLSWYKLFALADENSNNNHSTF